MQRLETLTPLCSIDFRRRLSLSEQDHDPVPCGSESSLYLWETHNQENNNDRSIDQRADDLSLQAEEVSLFTPGIMQGCEGRDQIN